MADLTEKQITEICTRSALEAVKEFSEKHPCRLSDSERSLVHAIHDIGIEEGANHGTWRVIVQTGKGWQDVTKKARNIGLAILFAIVVVVGSTWLGKNVLNFIGR